MTEIAIVTLMTVIAMFSVFLAIAVIWDYTKNKDTKLYKEGGWLFSNFTEAVYSILFKSDEVSVAKKFGIATDEYLSNCRVGGIKPNLKRYIVCYTGAIFMIATGVISALVMILLDVDYLIAAVVGVFLLLIGAALMDIEKTRAKSKAKEIKNRIVEEMPRFLDLLETALFIRMPIEMAIQMTAASVPSVLSDELLKAFEETKASEVSWMSILEKIANKYNVDCLNSFVQDVTTSYSKGVSIYDSIVRQNSMAKQGKMLAVEEKADKMKSAILIPVFIFKLIPIMAIFIIPALAMMQGFI